jgi:hypothetical protein
VLLEVRHDGRTDLHRRRPCRERQRGRKLVAGCGLAELHPHLRAERRIQPARLARQEPLDRLRVAVEDRHVQRGDSVAAGLVDGRACG